jgi:hypothetical protein
VTVTWSVPAPLRDQTLREPSVVEMTVADRVQLDRLTPAPRGYLAERHGHLLAPGVTRLELPSGHYFFKTLSDANLRVVTGGLTAGITAHDKDGDWPDPQKATGDPSAPGAKGDEASGEAPRLTIE